MKENWLNDVVRELYDLLHRIGKIMILQYALNLHKFFGDRMIHKGTINTMKENKYFDRNWGKSFRGLSSMQLRKLEFDESESFCIRYVHPRSLDGILSLVSRLLEDLKDQEFPQFFVG